MPHFQQFQIFTHTIIMSNPGPIIRLAKRRRTRRQPPMVEGDDSSLDTAMFVDQENGQKVLVPVWLDAPLTSASASDAVDLGTGSATYDEQNHVDMDADTDPPPS